MTTPAQRSRPRILISGAASGVGHACARALAGRGAELILCDTDGPELTRASEEVGGYSRYCDVVSEASIEAYAADIAAAYPSLEVLINAAGAGYVRTLGMVRMTRAMLPLLRRARGHRLIINIAPIGGFSRNDRMFPYAGSRECFQRLSEAIADQVRGSAIEVVMLTPRLVAAVSTNSPRPAQPYCFQRVDDWDIAERITGIVAQTVALTSPQPKIGSRSA
ncbi:MAG: SDR family oxidoreductase [Sphingomicrobium sp.]